MKKTLLTLGLTAMCSAMPALAADNMDMTKMMVDKHMKMMDANGDGMISKQEHDAAAEKMFMDADTNKDGAVSKDEMMALKMKEMKDMGAPKDSMMMKNDKMMIKK